MSRLRSATSNHYFEYILVFYFGSVKLSLPDHGSPRVAEDPQVRPLDVTESLYPPRCSVEVNYTSMERKKIFITAICDLRQY